MFIHVPSPKCLSIAIHIHIHVMYVCRLQMYVQYMYVLYLMYVCTCMHEYVQYRVPILPQVSDSGQISKSSCASVLTSRLDRVLP